MKNERFILSDGSENKVIVRPRKSNQTGQVASKTDILFAPDPFDDRFFSSPGAAARHGGVMLSPDDPMPIQPYIIRKIYG